jgi:hypothetical protein
MSKTCKYIGFFALTCITLRPSKTARVILSQINCQDLDYWGGVWEPFEIETESLFGWTCSALDEGQASRGLWRVCALIGL